MFYEILIFIEQLIYENSGTCIFWPGVTVYTLVSACASYNRINPNEAEAFSKSTKSGNKILKFMKFCTKLYFYVWRVFLIFTKQLIYKRQKKSKFGLAVTIQVLEQHSNNLQLRFLWRTFMKKMNQSNHQGLTNKSVQVLQFLRVFMHLPSFKSYLC